MSATLPDPESAWRASFHASDPLAEARSRLGSSVRVAEVLSGGRANLNLRVDSGPVLRIYTKDLRTARKEKRLLRVDWRSFRVPRVLDEGRDFVLLEWLDLHDVPDDVGHGRAVGDALAEIHSTTYESEGFLNAELRVAEPLPTAHDFMSEVIQELGRGWAWLETPLSALLTRYGEEGERDSAVLNHGDFKPSNLFLDADGHVVVLDWEFAFAGPRLFDCGQLFRWDPSEAFERGFEEGYRAAGGTLPQGWRTRSEVLDLLNLLGLARRVGDPSRTEDLRKRIALTLERA